ncbi:MAG: hypothetical protein P8J37_18565 [Fuerstiella sp.]|nr:hypothetical protein [Fuerstiella sp.]
MTHYILPAAGVCGKLQQAVTAIAINVLGAGCIVSCHSWALLIGAVFEMPGPVPAREG